MAKRDISRFTGKCPSLYLLITISLLFFILGNRGFTETRHPDGIIGKAGIIAAGEYISVISDKSRSAVDQKRGSVGIIIPFSARLSLSGEYAFGQGDSLFHEISLSSTIYTSRTAPGTGPCNPDGPLRRPVLILALGLMAPDRKIESPRSHVQAGLILPLSWRLSVGAGGIFYSKGEPLRDNIFLGTISLFPSSYPPDQAYTNPDAPEGTIAFSLKGGVSRTGYFGEIMVTFALGPGLTLRSNIRGDNFSEAGIKTATVGFAVRAYPGNK